MTISDESVIRYCLTVPLTLFESHMTLVPAGELCKYVNISTYRIANLIRSKPEVKTGSQRATT